jgi:ABC-type polysaccharide/polyol phosphate transport system ATPase subunit
MSKDSIAIKINNLSKDYKVYASHKDFLWELIFRNKKHVKKEVLKNISFEIKRGEIVGILGRNGAGKSTLLKLIAGTLNKTSGTLNVNGRLTAILELGSGFHSEYTGRENIYMGGMCLGMSRKEIDSKVDDIIKFSELEKVIDEPFRTYSTGMQARLTFSTAISVDPDILIIDEALSVGDARFQAKCFSRLNKLREKNTTILLVSHDTVTITSLCDRAVILENGEIFKHGNAKEISIAYQNLLFGGRSKSNDLEKKVTAADKEPQTSFDNAMYLRYGTGEAKLQNWYVLDEQLISNQVLKTGEKFRLSMSFICKKDIPDLSFGFAIKDLKGTVLWGITNVTSFDTSYSAKEGEEVTVVADSKVWLAAGHYSVTLGLAHLSDGEKIDFIEDAIIFKVLGPGRIFTTSIVNLETSFEISSNLKILKDRK